MGVKNIRLREEEMHHVLLSLLADVHILSHSLCYHSLSQTEASLKHTIQQFCLCSVISQYLPVVLNWWAETQKWDTGLFYQRAKNIYVYKNKEEESLHLLFCFLPMLRV